VSDWLLVRPAVPGDADALVALGRAVAAEDGLWLTYDRTRGDERRNVRSVQRDPNMAVFVAEAPEGVVGRLSIARDRAPHSRHVAEVGLMVAATARRRGIGAALMNEAMKWAQDAGVVKLELTVFPHNEPAIALYRKLGFREEGLIRRRYFIGGRYIDAMVMGLDLDTPAAD
jgi:RimJ/RimL family protein N-acetyltransferase